MIANIVLLALCLASGCGAAFFVRKRWRFTDTPTSDAAHVFPGLGEAHGVVEAIGAPVIAPSDGAPCVWWHYVVEREHTETKSTTNSDGTTSTSHTTTWETEEEGLSAHPFHLRDASGVVRVILDESIHVGRAVSIDVQHLSLQSLRSRATVMRKSYEPGAIAKAFGGIFGSNDPGRSPTPELAALVRETSDASNRLLARVEALPELSSQPNTAQLLAQLRLMNDRVGFARRFYNDCVSRLADRLTQFPDRLIGNVGGVKPLPLLDLNE